MSQDLFGHDDDQDQEDHLASGPVASLGESADKEHYDALIAREKFRRGKMDNDLRAGRLLYASESDRVLQESMSIVFSALSADVDAMPERLHGKSRGEIREIMVERYQSVVALAEAKINDYANSHGHSANGGQA